MANWSHDTYAWQLRLHYYTAAELDGKKEGSAPIPLAAAAAIVLAITGTALVAAASGSAVVENAVSGTAAIPAVSGTAHIDLVAGP